LITKWLTSTIL